jgi:hypothetical protein
MNGCESATSLLDPAFLLKFDPVGGNFGRWAVAVVDGPLEAIAFYVFIAICVVSVLYPSQRERLLNACHH